MKGWGNTSWVGSKRKGNRKTVQWQREFQQTPNWTTSASLLQNDNEISRTLAMTKTLVQILRPRMKSRDISRSNFVYNRLPNLRGTETGTAARSWQDLWRSQFWNNAINLKPRRRDVHLLHVKHQWPEFRAVLLCTRAERWGREVR